MILSLISPSLLQSQNLIPNSGFEDYYELPSKQSSAHLLRDWDNPNLNSSQLNGTPDYFHTEAKGDVQLPYSYFGVAYPFKGKGIIGIITYSSWTSDFREYITVKLKKKLVPGKKYKFSFYFSNGEEDQYGCFGTNKLGAAFTKGIPLQEGYRPINIKPQVEVHRVLYSTAWEKIEYQFVAEDAYQFMTIGNFSHDTQTIHKKIGHIGGKNSYYFIDEVTLVEVDPPIISESVDFIDAQPVPQTVSGRHIQTQKTFKVKSKEVIIKIWDSKKIDGDLISLKFNGEWVLKEYLLQRKPKTIKLNIDPDKDNALILFAHNLGSDPPNTAAISFYDRGKVNRIELKSDMNTCGAIDLVPIKSR